MKKLAQGFNAAAQDSNPGSRSRESEALPLSHGALPVTCDTLYITVVDCKLNKQIMKIMVTIYFKYNGTLKYSKS